MLLHGPFVGGAYIYIDPTPSKNVSASNIDVVPRNMGAILARGMHGGAALPGRWDDGMNASPPMPGGYAPCHTPASSSSTAVTGGYATPVITVGLCFRNEPLYAVTRQHSGGFRPFHRAKPVTGARGSARYSSFPPRDTPPHPMPARSCA